MKFVCDCRLTLVWSSSLIVQEPEALSGRPCRALREAWTFHLACACLLDDTTPTTALPHSPTVAPTPRSNPHHPVLHLPRQRCLVVLVANARRLSTQRAGIHGFLFLSDLLKSTHTDLFLLSVARAQARPYLSIAHCTPRPLRALFTSSFAAPLHYHHLSTTAVLHSLSTAPITKPFLTTNATPLTPPVCHYTTIPLAITAYLGASQDR